MVSAQGAAGAEVKGKLKCQPKDGWINACGGDNEPGWVLAFFAPIFGRLGNYRDALKEWLEL